MLVEPASIVHLLQAIDCGGDLTEVSATLLDKNIYLCGQTEWVLFVIRQQGLG